MFGKGYFFNKNYAVCKFYLSLAQFWGSSSKRRSLGGELKAKLIGRAWRIKRNDLDRYISSQDDESYERLIGNRGYDFDHQSHIKYLGVDATRIAWGMYCELDRKQSYSSYDFVQIVSDISRLAGAVFQSTIGVLETTGDHTTTKTLRDTWLSFSNITDAVAADFTNLSSNSQQLIVGFDRLLGASHTGGPIVERFTADRRKARGYREVLDIGKLSSLDELALCARVFRNYRYNHQSRT